MDDMRVSQGTPASQAPLAVDHDQRRQQERRDPRQDRPREQRGGAEELAVALDEHGRGSMMARFEQDAEGNPLVRIIDRERGETVAVLTPDELRELAEHAWLPPGLLLQARS